MDKGEPMTSAEQLLRELVAVKDLQARLQDAFFLKLPTWRELDDEYNRRLAPAWEAARAYLASAGDTTPPREPTDDEIIALRRATKAQDYTRPFGDTLAFARALLSLYAAPSAPAQSSQAQPEPTK